MKLECLDILNELLKRFGSLLKKEEAQGCLEALFTQLDARVAAQADSTQHRAGACSARLLVAAQLAALVWDCTLVHINGRNARWQPLIIFVLAGDTA